MGLKLRPRAVLRRHSRSGDVIRWALVGLMSATVVVLSGCRDHPTVDMNDVVSEQQGDGHADDRAALRVAVAATISPETTHDLYGPLLNLVASRVDRPAVFVQRRTYGEVNALMKIGEIDLALVCAGPYVIGHENFGMELLVVPVVAGKTVYHSYIIGRADEDIGGIEGLRNRRFAFTDPESNTGFLFPTFRLAEIGETPGSFFSAVVYTHGHDASIRAVADGLVDGAAVDSLVYDALEASGSEDVAKTKIIERSPPFGMPPVVVAPTMDAGLKKSLRNVFLNLHEDPAAVELMRPLHIERFVVANDKSYDSVRAMRRKLGEVEAADR